MELEAYLLSFIGASLSINESVTIAEVYFELKDWDAVKAKVKGENLIQARTKSSLRRVYQELSPRLQALSIAQLELLVEGNYQEKKNSFGLSIFKSLPYDPRPGKTCSSRRP